MKLEFKDEMLIPRINGEIYFSIYELENWLRRICLSVYMTEFGEDWVRNVPKKVFEGYQQRSRRSQEIFYLDADNEDNLIWSLTHAELSNMLLNGKVFDRVNSLIGLTYDRLRQKLDELREIRNLLAHNRALSERTGTIVQGIIASFYIAIDKFKVSFLYNKETEILFTGKYELSDYFEQKMEGNDWSKFQAFIEEGENIYSIVCLPVDRGENTYPSAFKLLEEFKVVLEYIISIRLNKSGDEYIITFPKRLSNENSKKIVDIFMRKSDVWTIISFEDQHPKNICNPRIWFYENRREIEE